MILKTRTIDEGWMFCTIENSIKSRCLTKEQYEFGIKENTPNHINIDSKFLYSPDGAIFVKVINIDCGRIIIYTNLKSYILNDNGKTIERVN